MRRLHSLVALTGIVSVLSVLAPPAQAQVRIELDQRFVQNLRNRVVAYYDFDVIGPQTTPHAPANDAEVHISGLAYKLPAGPGPATPYGFATVAEIMNAAGFVGPGGLLNWIAAQVGGPRVRMQGVWRFWAEHGSGNFIQGSVPPTATWNPRTNPAHVFEIHPISRVRRGAAWRDLRSTYTLPAGFNQPRDVNRTRGAFGYFERINSRIRTLGPGGTGNVEIRSDPHKYNFVGFTARIIGAPFPADDGGFFVDAAIYDQNGNGLDGTPSGPPLAKEVRLAVTGGSPPDAAIRATAIWSTIRLVGFPRIDMEQVHRAIQGGATYQGKLPYEIVITSLLP